jgi:hypothetical protein
VANKNFTNLAYFVKFRSQKAFRGPAAGAKRSNRFSLHFDIPIV